MKIGLDLDKTLYGFPEFFKAMIDSMSKDGHEFYCTSNWKRQKWDWHRTKIAYLGINPDLISPELLDTKQHLLNADGPQNKARMADQLDIVFDDHADHFQHLTKTPIMKCPSKKGKRRPSDEAIIGQLAEAMAAPITYGGIIQKDDIDHLCLDDFAYPNKELAKAYYKNDYKIPIDWMKSYRENNENVNGDE